MKRKPLAKTSASALANMPREELVKRVQTLEAQLACPRSAELQTTTEAKKTKKHRPFDLTLYPTAHVALKIAYMGWSYYGYASQTSFKPDHPHQQAGETSYHKRKPDNIANDSSLLDTFVTSIPTNNPSNSNVYNGSIFELNKAVPTVEDELFKALLATRLIQSPRSCNYSRCGRTDAGVSAAGQVVGVTIRSSSTKFAQLNKPSGTTHTIDLPIVSMLNRVLPKDIRVLSCIPAPMDFNARFDCTWREYRYFFAKERYDIDKMRVAAAKLLGTHDFRNFSKRDQSKPPVYNTIRTIFESEIVPISTKYAIDSKTPTSFEQVEPLTMFEYRIKGSAFLYHQVRCTMAILFLVGLNLEPPEIIEYLLDVSQCTERPTLKMASEIPLVLSDCGYDKISICESTTNLSEQATRVQSDVYQLWKEKTIQALTVQSVLRVEQINFDQSTEHQLHRPFREHAN